MLLFVIDDPKCFVIIPTSRVWARTTQAEQGPLTELELYNLRETIGEKMNLADKRPEKTQEQLNRLETWRERIGAPVPTERNPTYEAETEATAMKAGEGSPTGSRKIFE